MLQNNPPLERVQYNDLVLSSPEGTPWMTFPKSVITPLRRMVSLTNRDGDFPRRLALISSLRQEGVSYIARALGTTLAEDMEEKICVIELNWWWPSSTPEEIASTGGLAAVLSGELTLEEAVVKTSKRNLDILPAGNMPVEKRPPNARSSALHDLIDELSRRYEYLILDVPAITASPDAIPLASLGTACCLVIHQGATLVDEVRTALDDVDHLHLIGVVMNKNMSMIPSLLQKFLPH